MTKTGSGVKKILDRDIPTLTVIHLPVGFNSFPLTEALEVHIKITDGQFFVAKNAFLKNNLSALLVR